jgi:hypothetical protein
MINHLTIVVMAYNRPIALARLLNSIIQADLNGYSFNFIFSLEKNSNNEVVKLVNDFELNGINKTIIQSDISLGAEGHNLAVQQLALNYDNLLILEDDSFVSPYIFDYAFAALNFYYQNKGIAAISLYPYLWVESVSVPFVPLYDGYFNYFQQRPTSHGYILSKNQVIKFNEWQETFSENRNQLPPNTLSWNKLSWERVWYNYLIETNQFTVFPRVAFNTVFGELGYNVKNSDERNAFQQALALDKSEYHFSTLENSLSVYDAFYEFLRYDNLGFTNVEGNLYGTKDKSTLRSDFVATNGFHSSALKTFGRDLKPIEINITLNNPGNEISIIKKNEYKNTSVNHLNNHLYFNNLFSLPKIQIILKYYIRRLGIRLRVIK